MAIDNRLQVFNEEGQSVDYDILASDVKFLPDGKDLPTKLAELEQGIEDAGSGDGTVTGVKVGSTTYEPIEGVVDISQGIPDVSGKANKSEMSVVPGTGANADKTTITLKEGTNATVLTQHQDISGKVDKDPNKELIPSTDLAKLQSLPTATELTQQMGTKANDNAVVKSVTINGQTPQLNDGNVSFTVTGAQGPKGDTGATGPQGPAGPQGPKGDSGVASADEVVVVNDLDGEPDNLEEGQVAVLSAEMGKILSEMIEEGGDTIDISYNSSRKAIVITSANAPLVKTSTPSRASLSCRAGSTDTVTFMVRGKRLIMPIAISVSDPINWQVSPAQVSPAQDGDVALTTITVTYRPASGTATGTQHSCVVTISYNNETQSTINLQGEVLAAPTINVPSSLTINKYEGGVGSGVVRVSGVGLEGDVSLALSGSGFSFSGSATQTALTVSKADAIAGIDVPVYFSGSEDTNGTLTASSTAATNAVTSLVGHIAVPAALDTEFVDNGLKYKVKTVAAQNAHGELKLINPAGESSTSTSTYSGAISIPATIEKDGFVYDVVSIGSNAFYRANGVTSVVIGDNVTNIGSQAFAECSNMTSISIGNGVTTISNNVFTSCGKLANVTIGNSVTTIGARAFSMASVLGGSLQSITLPDSVTSLGDYVFSGCTKLTTVKIGTTTGCQMSSISSAFYNCSGIVKVTCYATSVPSISATADNFMPASSRTAATLEVPSASKSNYEGDSKWGTFGNITAITE